MIVLDLEFLDKLVNRFKGYNSPTDTQKLLIMLAEKPNRDNKDNKKLSMIMKTEKAAERLFKSKNAEREVVEKIKATKRKARTHADIVLGSSIRIGSTVDIKLAEMMIYTFDNGYISKKNMDVVRDDVEAARRFIETKRGNLPVTNNS